MDPVIPGWRAEYPYRIDADDVVSRREFLRFAILSSGALFLGTVVLALLTPFRRGAAVVPKTIARVGEIPLGEARYFRFPGPDDEAVVINTRAAGLVAYSQKCTHLSCSVTYQRDEARLYCPCHDGVFDLVSGEPVAGPPQRALPRIVLQQHGDQIVAVDTEP